MKRWLGCVLNLRFSQLITIEVLSSIFETGEIRAFASFYRNIWRISLIIIKDSINKRKFRRYLKKNMRFFGRIWAEVTVRRLWASIAQHYKDWRNWYAIEWHQGANLSCNVFPLNKVVCFVKVVIVGYDIMRCWKYYYIFPEVLSSFFFLKSWSFPEELPVWWCAVSKEMQFNAALPALFGESLSYFQSCSWGLFFF